MNFLSYIKRFYQSHKNDIVNVLYVYSHFFMIILSLIYSFITIGFFIYFFIKGIAFNFLYMFIAFSLLVAMLPYIFDLFSRGIYNYPFFAMFFFKDDKYKINSFIIYIYKYAKFCFFMNSMIIVLSAIFLVLSGFNMLIFSKDHYSINAFVSNAFILLFLSPIAYEMYSYGWTNKTAYLPY